MREVNRKYGDVREKKEDGQTYKDTGERPRRRRGDGKSLFGKLNNVPEEIGDHQNRTGD